MAGPTKADLQAQNAGLQKKLLDAELARDAADEKVLAEQRKASKEGERRAEAATAAMHYKAQRDALTGYIAGTRDDRDKPGLTVLDEYGNTRPRPTTLLDDFLERMREEPSWNLPMTVTDTSNYRRRP